MTTNRPVLTFFHTDNCERQAVAPIAEEAERRGYPVRFTTRMDERAQVGIYCQHACRPNANFSVILLHDLAQRHDIWPAFWRAEPWSEFDIGFVPGEAWAARWRSQAGDPGAHPRRGVFDIGWPKADLVWRDRTAFAEQSARLRAELGLRHAQSVLYAPSWENHGKQDDFVQALAGLPVNLLLKQAPWAAHYTQVWDAIHAMNARHQGLPGVHIVDPEVSIMYAIGIADVLVSDESSVLIEAALHGVPSVAVSDWTIPDREPPRLATVPFDHVRKTPLAGLRGTVEAILADPAVARADAAALRDHHFSHFGESAVLAMDVIEAALEGRAAPIEALAAPSVPASAAAVPDGYVFNAELGIHERPRPAGFAYNDGDETENRIWRIVRETADVSLGSDELLAQANDWPSYYHFNPVRANVMRPLEGQLRGRSVLELGSGCGAISRYLAEAGCRLTCVEGSRRRASITASRCRGAGGTDGVRVFNDNFQDFTTTERFDVVTMIGVLEYSRSFIGGDDPIAAALEIARGFLKPGGVLVVAIENQLGLKYWAGAPEDHVGLPFFGLESLYEPRGPVTFGRRQLARILRTAGFPRADFYYPFPDYKLPASVIAESALDEDPALAHNLLAGMFAPDQATPYIRTLSEGAAWRALVDNGLVGDLTNSFLVVAKLDGSDWPDNRDALAFTYSTARHRSSSKEVRIHRADGNLRVARRMLFDDPRPAGLRLLPDEALLPGELLFNRLLPIVNRPGWGVDALADWAAPLHDLLRREVRGSGANATLPGHFFDATPFNAIGSAAAGWRLFDLEWVPADAIDALQPLFRGVLHSLARAGSVAPPRDGTPRQLADLAAAVVERLAGRRPDVERLLAMESRFMADATGRLTTPDQMAGQALPVRVPQEWLRQAWEGRGTAAAPGTAAATAAGSARRGPPRIAVVLHLYYPDLWPEFAEALRRLPPGFDLYVTTVPAHTEAVRALLARDFPAARLLETENRGRDVRPFLAVLQQAALEDYEFVLKLHTKKSPHLAAGVGDAWRRGLLAQLVPHQGVEAVWRRFDRDPTLGILGPAGQVLSAQAFAGVQAARLRELATTLGFDFDQTPYLFVAGTMFWMRGAVLREVRAAAFSLDAYEPEAGQVDGTLAHAMERLFPLVALRAGLRTEAFSAADAALDQLAERTPSPAAGRLIEARLAAHGGGPSVCVLVRADAPGAIDRLGATLESLRFGANLYAPVKVVVLVASGAGGTTAEDRVHLVETGGANPVDVLNLAAMQSDCDWLLLAEAGDTFTRSGLLLAALQAIDAPDTRALCCDELRRTPDGALGAAFRPDFNLDLLLSLPASMARHWLVRRDAWVGAGGWDPQRGRAIEFDLLLRLVDAGGVDGFGHVAEPLLTTASPTWVDDPQEQAALLRHLHGRGYADAEVVGSPPGHWRIRYGHAAQPRVSILIPTRDQLPVLQRCVESILEKTSYPHYEVVIVDNGSTAPDAVQWLAGVEAMQSEQVRILRHPHPFNYSEINNLAARHARGDYLVLLNNDTAVVQADWIENLLNHALRPEVGIVGAKLLYPDGKVQHAGVLLGLRGPADHPFIGAPLGEPGYMHRLLVDQDLSAVTGACLMVRRSLYEALGGLDEQDFKVSYNDVDFCLRVRAAGHLVVWTPHAVLMHEGSVSQTKVDVAPGPEKVARFQGEQAAMYRRWLPVLARDPAYNPNLSLDGSGYELEPDFRLAFHPLAWKPVPRIVAMAADETGCGNYRVIKPMQGMLEGGLAEGLLTSNHWGVVELERYAPDAIVFQRQLHDAQIDALARVKAHSRAFTVYELDDYLPNVPVKSAHWGELSQDIPRSMRRALAQVDRFVVSTDALAEAFAGYHPDTVVVQNRLPTDWWGGLRGRRRGGDKLRVGWAGGGGHRGDLELIADVMKALHGEVHWVFFGMCPEKLRPFVHEFHDPVAIETYPAALARLDLDLALAPLEDNLFNRCKSNLRLLEYGACGFPVVCTDIEPYRCGLSVTRVKNRFKDWVDAVRMHVADRDATARAGDALRSEVVSGWMLEGVHLERWRDVWTGR